MLLPDPQDVSFGAGRARFLASPPTAGLPVVLLHGGGFDCASLSWRYLFPELARNATVIAPNWPGYGGSTLLGHSYTIADLGAWLLAFMDALNIGKANVVGVSMGGGVGLWMAVNQPDRVARLVPVAPYGVQRRAPYHLLSYLAVRLRLNTLSEPLLRRSRLAVRHALQQIFAESSKVTDELVGEIHDLLNANGHRNAFENFQHGEITRGGLRTYLTPRLAEAPHPTLFIQGRADPLVPLTAVQRAAAVMPNAELYVMNAGHWPMRECVSLFNARVKTFLKVEPS